MNELTDYPDVPLCQKIHHYNARQANSRQLVIPRARTLQFQRSFFPDTIKSWNSLPSQVLSCTSLSMSSYLCNRRQYVVLNGKESSIIDVVSGVPQGSVLGPLLFLLYINDSVQEPLSDGTLISLYADDILMYRIINCVRDYKMLQSDIDTVSRWVDINELALNHIKCKYMVVLRLKSRAVPSPTMLLYGQPMERVTNYKYLGVLLTEECPGLFTLRRFHVRPGGWLGCYTDDFTDGLLQVP